MDLKLVGSFISERRKEMEISQEELAEQLGVNVKVVARWENGKRFPASDFILPLCKILDITANDLVSGKKVSDEEYKDFAEDNILKAVDARNVRKFTSIFSLVSICAALLAAISLLYVIVRVKTSVAMLVISIIVIVLVICASVFSLIVLFGEPCYRSYFVCPDCKTRFTPEIKAYMTAKKAFFARELECPNCGKTNYCKHKFIVCTTGKENLEVEEVETEVEETETEAENNETEE